MKVYLIALILLLPLSVFPQTDERETLKKLNQVALSSYKAGDFNEAQKNAQQAVDLSVKIFGNESLQAASAFSNLGIILREKKKYEESIIYLQKAVDIYQKLSGTTKQNFSEALELLAFSQMLDGRMDEAEANYLRAIEITEEQFGRDSKESYLLLLNTAGFYSRSKNFEKADEFYLRSYAVAVKNFGKRAKELEEIENLRACLTAPQNYMKNQKNYAEKRREIIGENSDYGGILNAKTKILPPPKYPSEARSQRLGATIPVRVKIDEKGNVVEAKAICGSPILGEASEEAARGAKFEIVEVSGQPIKYSGILVYTFVP